MRSKISPGSRRQKGVSAIIAAILIMGMILTVTFTYFYVTTQDQQIYDQALKSQQQNILESNLENLIIYGAISNGILGFYTNNTGLSTSIVAYWIYSGSTGAIDQYQNTSNSGGLLPFYVGQGRSVFYPNTGVVDSNPYQQFVIKVLTSRGNTFIGTYPSSLVASSSLNSLVAAGLGSLQMQFSSFTWYSYTSGPQAIDDDNDYNQYCAGGKVCAGGSYVLNLAQPNSGSYIPEGNTSTIQENCPLGPPYCGTRVPVAFSVSITNSDPTQASLVINSEANLWIMQTCDSGLSNESCSGVSNPVYVFYIMNVNPITGVVSSTTPGSFSPITIPYGSTQTIFFGSACDLSQTVVGCDAPDPNNGGFQDLSMSITSDDQNGGTGSGINKGFVGEFATFLLFSGTRIPPQSIIAYGQNIPFESMIVADNVATYSEIPTQCTSGVPTVFALTVNNSPFTPSNITEVQVNASAFSSVSATPPSWWNYAINKGEITWTSYNMTYSIQPNQSQTFIWYGVAPYTGSSSQLIFPVSIHWYNGALTQLQTVGECLDSSAPSLTIPSGAVAYVPIYLFNLQNSASSTNTTLMLQMNWSQYSAYLDNPVDNVLFFDSNDNVLNSWMENGTANSATNSIVWVNMASDIIGAKSASVIYMAIYPKGQSQLGTNGPFGEAPQLSSTYGKYDDGAIVFGAYVNGNAPTSQFNPGSSITLQQATGVAYPGTSGINALWLSGTGNYVTMVYKGKTLSNSPMIVESNFKSLALPTSQGAVSLDDNINPGSSQNAIGLDSGYSSSYFSQAFESGGSYTFDQNPQGTDNSNWAYASMTYLGSSATSWYGYIAPQLYSTSGGYTGTYNNNPLSGKSTLYLSILSSASRSYPDNMYYNWIRVRTPPPNDIMPTVILGSLVPA